MLIDELEINPTDLTSEFSFLSEEQAAAIVSFFNQRVTDILDDRTGIIESSSSCKDETLPCGCTVTVSLESFANTDTFDSLDIGIDWCESHNAASDYKEGLRKLLFEMWIKDEEVRFNPELRDLFKLVNL